MKRQIPLSVLSVLLLLTAAATATDLPPSQPRPATPAAPAASPLNPPDATCLEWTDGCRTCQRPQGGEAACSNVGLACVQQAARCTRR